MGNKKHGKIDRMDQVKVIMSYYKKNPLEWSDRRRRFTERKANAFFVSVMLDQMQKADRAWKAGKYMAENYFNDTGDFWKEISDTHLSTIKIKKICIKGYEEKAFALGVKVNYFPKNLKLAAKKIVDQYGSDVRNIWNVDAEHVDEIYNRFKEFYGIGDALAKMAQFILVRDYGIAGGRYSKKYLLVKPDIHLQRVLFRLGITEAKATASVIANVNDMKLRSPADFDWAVWNIGREYCHSSKPDCSKCPLEKICEKRL